MSRGTLPPASDLDLPWLPQQAGSDQEVRDDLLSANRDGMFLFASARALGACTLPVSAPWGSMHLGPNSSGYTWNHMAYSHR